MKFSIIVPLLDANAHLLPSTLSSALAQQSASYELILVDGRMSSAELEIQEAPHLRRLRLPQKNMFALLNGGLESATGDVVHFLLPGEFYLTSHALRLMGEFWEHHHCPDLVHTGYIVRHSLTPRQLIFKPLSRKELLTQPSLQSFWFKRENLSPFSTLYEIQGGMDLICRLYRSPKLRHVFYRRILTDYEYRRAPAKRVILRYLETLEIIAAHFGWNKALWWGIAQDSGHLLHWGWKNLQGIFWKRSHA